MRTRTPNRWRCALSIWIAAYPLMTLLSVALAPVTSGWPIPLRTLLLTVLMTPAMVFWLVPAVSTHVLRMPDSTGKPRCRLQHPPRD